MKLTARMIQNEGWELTLESDVDEIYFAGVGSGTFAPSVVVDNITVLDVSGTIVDVRRLNEKVAL